MPNIVVSNYFSAAQTQIGSVLANGRRQYIIPLNQRPFVWGVKHINAIWSDFLRQVNAGYTKIVQDQFWVEKAQPSEFPHFIGNFIFVQRAARTGVNDEVDVYDGQQRLTVLTMLATCLLEVGEELITGTPNDLDLRRAVQKLEGWILAEPHPAEHRPRLRTDAAFSALYEAIILRSRQHPLRKQAVDQLQIDFKEKKDHKNLWDRFCDLHAKVRDYVQPMTIGERIKFIVAARSTLNEAFVGIVTEVKSEAYGLRIFSNLNTLAAPLTAVDNLKNEFFVRITDSHHPNVSADWWGIIEALGTIAPKDFLRRRMISLGNQCSNDEQGLFLSISTHELDAKSEQQLLSLLAVWRSEAVSLRNIRSGNGFNSLAKRYLRDIYDVLGASIADIFLLAAHRKYIPADQTTFVECCRIVRNYLFRDLTVGQEDTSKLERRLKEASIALSSGSIADAKIVLGKASSDDAFYKNFAQRADDRPKIQFFSLFCIEEYLASAAGMQPYPASPRQHIEHIVPKNVERSLPNGKPAWPFWKNRVRSLHERYLNRLGNILLLEADINQSVRNRSIEEKVNGIHLRANGSVRRKGYLDSSLSLPKKLVRRHVTSFDASDIDVRQRALARLALRIWTLF